MLGDNDSSSICKNYVNVALGCHDDTELIPGQKFTGKASIQIPQVSNKGIYKALWFTKIGKKTSSLPKQQPKPLLKTLHPDILSTCVSLQALLWP
jgi:hypothetical protein